MLDRIDNPLENLPIDIIDQDMMKEILGSEPTKAYITLKTKLAEIELKLAESKGWFWKRAVLNAVQQEQLLALRDVYTIALRQVVKSLEDDGAKGLSVELRVFGR